MKVVLGGSQIFLLALLAMEFFPSFTHGSDFTSKFSKSELAMFHELAPEVLPKAPPDKSNRFSMDPRASKLGEKLFSDPGFSGTLIDGDNNGTPTTLGVKGQTGRVSCVGCHIPASGFTDTRSPGQQISLAAGWGVRRAPSLLDVAQEKLFMWDGRRDALYNQIFSVIESPVEMNSSRLYVAEQIASRYRPEYEELFGKLPPFEDTKRFPVISPEKTGCHPDHIDPKSDCPGIKHGLPGDDAEYDHLSDRDKDAVTRVVVNMGKAIGAFERKFTCGPSKFDAWVHGEDDALSQSEKNGAKLFIGKAKCISCHSGSYFSDFKFHNVGLRARPVASAFHDINDSGAYYGLTTALKDPLNVHGKFSDGDDKRLPAKVAPEMLGAFKTPKLRCVSQRPSFMHTGQITTLKQAVEFFNRGGDSMPSIGRSEIGPLNLSETEVSELVDFLGSLNNQK